MFFLPDNAVVFSSPTPSQGDAGKLEVLLCVTRENHTVVVVDRPSSPEQKRTVIQRLRRGTLLDEFNEVIRLNVEKRSDECRWSAFVVGS